MGNVAGLGQQFPFAFRFSNATKIIDAYLLVTIRKPTEIFSLTRAVLYVRLNAK